jgi:hypothetical protein
MNWETVMGEILPYDGTTDCIDVLQTQDLYIQDGHLREMLSLESCVDYGPIEIGDTILLLIGKIYILKNLDRKRD